MNRPRGEHVPPQLQDRPRVATAIGALNDIKQRSPVCLLHGDPHMGNMFFDADGGGLFDWQLFTSGHWAYDVVWSMVGAMTIEARRATDRDLLTHYTEVGKRHATAAVDLDSLKLLGV